MWCVIYLYIYITLVWFKPRSYQDPPWPTCTCSLWDEPFLLLPVTETITSVTVGFFFFWKFIAWIVSLKNNSTYVVCSAYTLFFLEWLYCTELSRFPSIQLQKIQPRTTAWEIRCNICYLLLWESEACSPRRPWTDELGRIQCHLWWNSHLLQPRESFLGWRRCPWTVSPSVPARDNANISMPGAEAFCRDSKGMFVNITDL